MLDRTAVIGGLYETAPPFSWIVCMCPDTGSSDFFWTWFCGCLAV